MWVFTEIANGFDEVKAEKGKALLEWLQDWVATTEKDDSPWYRTR